MTFTDHRGQAYPTFEPGGIYLGSLTRNRICYDHAGRKLKVLNVGEGSVSVRRFTPPETLTLAPTSVVYLRPGGAPPGAPPTPPEE